MNERLKEATRLMKDVESAAETYAVAVSDVAKAEAWKAETKRRLLNATADLRDYVIPEPTDTSTEVPK